MVTLSLLITEHQQKQGYQYLDDYFPPNTIIKGVIEPCSFCCGSYIPDDNNTMITRISSLITGNNDKGKCEKYEKYLSDKTIKSTDLNIICIVNTIFDLKDSIKILLYGDGKNKKLRKPKEFLKSFYSETCFDGDGKNKDKISTIPINLFSQDNLK